MPLVAIAAARSPIPQSNTDKSDADFHISHINCFPAAFQRPSDSFYPTIPTTVLFRLPGYRIVAPTKL